MSLPFWPSLFVPSLGHTPAVLLSHLYTHTHTHTRTQTHAHTHALSPALIEPLVTQQRPVSLAVPHHSPSPPLLLPPPLLSLASSSARRAEGTKAHTLGKCHTAYATASSGAIRDVRLSPPTCSSSLYPFLSFASVPLFLLLLSACAVSLPLFRLA